MAKDGKWTGGSFGNTDKLTDEEKALAAKSRGDQANMLKANFVKLDEERKTYTEVIEDIDPPARWMLVGVKRETSSGIILANGKDRDPSSNNWGTVLKVGSGIDFYKPNDECFILYQNRPWFMDMPEFHTKEYDLYIILEADTLLRKRKKVKENLTGIQN